MPYEREWFDCLRTLESEGPRRFRYTVSHEVPRYSRHMLELLAMQHIRGELLEAWADFGQTCGPQVKQACGAYRFSLQLGPF